MRMLPCRLHALFLALAAVGLAPRAASQEAARRLAGGEASTPFGRPPNSLPSLSNISADIVSGLIEAFLHKQRLPKEELHCLVKGTGVFAGRVIDAASRTVVIAQEILGVRETGPRLAMKRAMAEKAKDSEGKLAKDMRAAARRLGADGMLEVALSASQVFLELGLNIQKIALLSRSIIKDCIRGDAKEALRIAAAHMRSMKYISGRFLANGADVVREVDDAAKAWNRRDNRQFGYMIGKALRKVLLSNSTNGSLPEGPPNEFILGNITVGLADGFLGSGFALDIKLADRPDNSVHINLRRCVGKNLVFFQSAWSATLYFFAQQATQDTDDTHEYREVRERFSKQLAFTMMQLPHALRNCDIDEHREKALLDSIKAFGSGMQMHIDVPMRGKSGLVKQMESGIQKAVGKWSHSNWYAFGVELGKLLQSIAMVMFPEKYSVDASGGLQRQVLEVQVEERGARLLAAPAALLASGLVAALGGRRALTSLRAPAAAAGAPAPLGAECPE